MHCTALQTWSTQSTRVSQGLIPGLIWSICFLQTRSFSPNNMLIDGLDWSGVDYLWIILFIVMILSAVWTLILMAPIHCKVLMGEQIMYCNAKFLQICSDEETNSSTSWMPRGWVHFWVNYSFKDSFIFHSCFSMLYQWDFTLCVAFFII